MLGMILIQINVVSAYLESVLGQNKQPIYMKISQKCLAGRKKLVCKILKSLRIEASKKALEQDNYQVFPKNLLYLINTDACIFIIK